MRLESCREEEALHLYQVRQKIYITSSRVSIVIKMSRWPVNIAPELTVIFAQASAFGFIFYSLSNGQEICFLQKRRNVVSFSNDFLAKKKTDARILNL